MNLKKSLLFFVMLGLLFIGFQSCKSKISDSDLKVKVEEAVKNAPNVIVSVQEGIVTLSGAVFSEQEREIIGDAASKADKGIKSLVNNITVQTPIATNTVDSDLTPKVAEFTKDFQGIQTTVVDGVITVTGTVEQSRLSILKQGLDALNPKKVDLSGITIVN